MSTERNQEMAEDLWDATTPYGREIEAEREADAAEQRRLDTIDAEFGLLDKLDRGIKPEPGEYATRKEWLLVGLFITVMLAIVLFVAAMIFWMPSANAEPSRNSTCSALDHNPTVGGIAVVVWDNYDAGISPEESADVIFFDVSKGCPEYMHVIRDFAATFDGNPNTEPTPTSLR